MIRDITIGQYYSVDSPIHRLDPRVKIIAATLYIIEIFIVSNFWGFLISASALGIVVAISKVPVSYIMRGLKPILFILFFTFAMNIFMIDGKELWRWGIFKITDTGIYTAVFMGIRLLLLIIGTSLLTLTTTPISLTDGIEKLLLPLEKLKFSVHDVAMMMSIALRFIPILMEETDKIIKAQQARGADFETGNIFARAKALVPILIPLFVSAFRIALALALAMEARCYRGGVGRTKMNVMRYKKGDYFAFILLILFFAIIILDRIYL